MSKNDIVQMEYIELCCATLLNIVLISLSDVVNGILIESFNKAFNLCRLKTIMVLPLTFIG